MKIKEREKQPALSWGTFGICPLFLPTLVFCFVGVEGKIGRERQLWMSTPWVQERVLYPVFWPNCPPIPQEKRKETRSLALHPEESTQGWLGILQEGANCKSPPPELRVKGFPPTSCYLSMKTCALIEPNAILRMYQKPTHWQAMLQLSSAFFRPMHSVSPCCRDSRESFWWCPTPFGCTVVIGEAWVFFFIVTFISAGQ